MAWISSHIIPFDRHSQKIQIHAAADFQLGSTAADERMVKSWVREVAADKDGVSVIAGDITDDDRPTTRERKRAMNADRMDSLLQESSRWMKYEGPALLEMLLPLAKTRLGCLGFLAGHHWRELWIRNENAEDGVRTLNSVSWLCRELSRISGRPVPYLGEMSAWIWLRFRWKGETNNSVSRCLHVQHGTGGGQTLASAITKLDGTTRAIWADAYIRAHDCKLVGGKIDMLYPNTSDTNPQILCRTIPLLNLGSATRGYELSRGEPNYVEKGMMRPTTMGFGILQATVVRRLKSQITGKPWDVDFRLDF